MAKAAKAEVGSATAVESATGKALPKDEQMSPAQVILASQGLIGNRTTGLLLQAKLVVGSADDPAEAQADRLAELAVARMSETSDRSATSEESTGHKGTEVVTAEKMMSSSHALAQMKPLSIGPEGGSADPQTERSILQARSGGESMPDQIRSSMESGFGTDLSEVRIHRDTRSHELNERLQARAFTTANHIFFRSGQFQPHSPDGKLLLAHELAHTLQQRPADEVDRNMIRRVRERRNAISVAPGIERVIGLPSSGLERVLKFNFAGSGESMWKTHKGKYAKPDLELTNEDHSAGGENKKFKRYKSSPGIHETVIEYPGPGRLDYGTQNTANNLRDAQTEFLSYMEWHGWNVPEGSRVQINIKGFSRGAATGSTFAQWIKASRYSEWCSVNIVLIDPVHGTDPSGGLLGGSSRFGQMAQQMDVTAAENSTYLLPIRSGHWTNAFTPQNIIGHKRLIVGYGTAVKHAFGLGEVNRETGASNQLKWDGREVKGMDYSTLPEGLFIVNTGTRIIERVPTWAHWHRVEAMVFASASRTDWEGRKNVVRRSLERLLGPRPPEHHEAEGTTFIMNPMHRRTGGPPTAGPPPAGPPPAGPPTAGPVNESALDRDRRYEERFGSELRRLVTPRIIGEDEIRRAWDRFREAMRRNELNLARYGETGWGRDPSTGQALAVQPHDTTEEQLAKLDAFRRDIGFLTELVGTQEGEALVVEDVTLWSNIEIGRPAANDRELNSNLGLRSGGTPLNRTSMGALLDLFAVGAREGEAPDLANSAGNLLLSDNQPYMAWGGSFNVWAAVSADFAARASGEVHVYVPSGATTGSVFWTAELPELRRNVAVTNIVIHQLSDTAQAAVAGRGREPLTPITRAMLSQSASWKTSSIEMLKVTGIGGGPGVTGGALTELGNRWKRTAARRRLTTERTT